METMGEAEIEEALKGLPETQVLEIRLTDGRKLRTIKSDIQVGRSTLTVLRPTPSIARIPIPANRVSSIQAR